MSTFELAKDYILDHRYQIRDEDSVKGHIAFRYQLNVIHFWGNPNDEKFFFMTLPKFADVTEENIAQVKDNCHEVNKQAKLVKMYILNGVILAAAEVYYLQKEDFDFQMQNSLKHLVAAKVMYRQLDE